MKMFVFGLDRRNTDAAKACIDSAIRATDKDIVRVELHSIDDPPWPTERPEGWGAGCWCEFRDRHGVLRQVIALKLFSDAFGVLCKAITVENGEWWTVPIKGITSFGPRAEVPG